MQAKVSVLRPRDGCLVPLQTTDRWLQLRSEIREMTTALPWKKTDYYSPAPKYQTDECSSAPEKDNNGSSSASKEDRNYYKSAPKDYRCMIAALFRNKTDYYSTSPKYDRKMTTALLRKETKELLQLWSERRLLQLPRISDRYQLDYMTSQVTR